MNFENHRAARLSGVPGASSPNRPDARTQRKSHGAEHAGADAREAHRHGESQGAEGQQSKSHAGNHRDLIHLSGDHDLPRVPTGQPDLCLRIAHDPFDPQSERIRALRTELLLRRQRDRGAQMIALLSPCHHEGRSHLAAELAIAFAQLGRPSLLVDADLRHPTQQDLFNLPDMPGLYQALTTGEPVTPARVRDFPDLAVLPAGHGATNPLELLSHSRFGVLVDVWRDEYDFVIFDTSPVGRYSDALAVASMVGDVLTLSHAQHTPYRQARDLLRRLTVTESRIVGAVMTHF